MLTRVVTAAAALALTAAAATAQIELNDKLAITGFIDMSVLSNDGTTGMSLDQTELDFIFDLGDGLSSSPGRDSTRDSRRAN